MLKEQSGLLVILTGGLSRRMGTPKALLPVRTGCSTTFLQQICQRTASLGCYRGVVSSLPEGVLGVDLPAVQQTRPEEGLLSSVMLGWRTWGREAAWLMICLVDHPYVQEETYHRLLQARKEGPHALLWSLSHQHRGGHPALFSREFVHLLETIPTELGPRPAIVKAGSRRHWVEVEDPAILWDIDTPEAYEYYRLLSTQGEHFRT